MKIRFLYLVLLLVSQSAFSGCALWRFDPYNVLIRSDIITTPEKEKEILAKARLTWTDDYKVRVIYVSGTPYERGYQQGVLLRKEIQDNLGTLYRNALSKFHTNMIFEEAFERLRPFIPEEYMDEMHGLAHGSKLPLEMIHHIHALPSITEWGGKKRLKTVIERMLAGEDLGTSCSNFCVLPKTTENGQLITVRILDWGMHKISKLHEYPLITVNQPENGIASANIGWVGFLGAVSGMNAEGITLGEMGNGDNDRETLAGKPMVFLLRDVLSYAHNLSEVRKIIKDSPGTNAFGFLMSDGKTSQAELYMRDRDNFIVFEPGKTINNRDSVFPGISNIVYGGHYEDKLHQDLSLNSGKFSPELFMKKIIPNVAMPSNFQNVIYDPANLRFWVANSTGSKHRAAEQDYTYFELSK